MQAHGHGGQPHECISKAVNSSVQRWPWIFQTITKSSRLEGQKDSPSLPPPPIPPHPHIRTRVLDCWLPVVGERLVLLFNSLFFYFKNFLRNGIKRYKEKFSKNLNFLDQTFRLSVSRNQIEKLWVSFEFWEEKRRHQICKWDDGRLRIWFH